MVGLSMPATTGVAIDGEVTRRTACESQRLARQAARKADSTSIEFAGLDWRINRCRRVHATIQRMAIAPQPISHKAAIAESSLVDHDALSK